MSKLTCSQLHYTSCRYGLSGNAGFQTRAMSNDIRPEEQRAMERLGLYQPPRNQEQIDAMFPIAYRNAYLETGKLAVLRSVYVGKDYTGRGGNYFAHALLIEQMPTNIWPADLYEWDNWKGKLEDNEDTEQATFNLQTLNIVPNETAYSFANMQEFLQEEKSRPRLLAQMIQAVLLRSETSRSLVIQEDMMNNCSFWIACIQKSFPATCQQTLSCSSYQFDPRTCLAVNAIYGETDFSLGESERKYQFYVFDFINNIHSHVGDAHSEYAAIISSWMCQQPKKLESFYEFSNQFELSDLNTGLITMLRLYRISIGNSLSLSDDELIQILEFVNSHSKEKHFNAILDIISSAINQLSNSDNPDYICHLAVFFINGAKASGSYDIRTKAYKLILRLFNNLIFNKTISVGKLEEVRSFARNSYAVYDEEFSELFLTEQNLSTLYSNIHLLDNQSLSIVMKELIFAISFLSGEKEPLKDQRLLYFIAKVIMAKQPDLSNIDWLFLFFSDSTNDTATICIYVSEVLDGLTESSESYDESINAFSLYLSNLLKSKGDVYYFNVINLIQKNSVAWILLEKEWQHSISNKKDKISFHANYDHHIFEQNSEFSKAYRIEFAEMLWKLLSPKEQISQAITWINTDYIRYFPKQLLNTVFQKVNESISFNLSDQDSDVLSELLIGKISKFTIELKPDRLTLRQAIYSAHDKTVNFDEQSLVMVKKALSNSDLKTYEEFTTAYLPKILTKALNPEQHGAVIGFILLKPFSDSFLKAYQRFFEQGKANQFDNAEKAALQFWVLLASNDENYGKYKDIREETIELLVSRIAKLKEPLAKKLMRVSLAEENLTPTQKKKLTEIFQKVEDKRNTFWRRVMRSSSENLKKLTKKQENKDV